MFVLKADGTKEEFDEGKIIKTCIRAGVSNKTAREIAERIRKGSEEGMSTHDIYRMIIAELERREDRSSVLFRLREAVALLDSKSFELYIKEVLESNGYRCQWNKKIKGLYVEHQVDIIAENEQGVFLVECKRHVNPHRFTGLNIPLQVQARLEDVENGSKKGINSYRFSAAWIVTNGKFSDHAKAYSKGKNLRLSGWRYQPKISLEELIQGKKVFPVTILKTEENFADEMLGKDIITIEDFLSSKISRKPEYAEMAEQARALLK